MGNFVAEYGCETVVVLGYGQDAGVDKNLSAGDDKGI